MPELLVGTSGYNYRHWGQGVFYPPGLSSHRWLEYYAQHFGAVELNVTFYRLPEPKTFAGWHRRTPNDFRFVVKGSRLITHVRRLKGVEDALAVFFQNASALGDKLSCALWQLPPRFPQDVGLLAQFIRQLPRSCRHSIEFRDESWLTEEVYELLREAGISLCLADRPLNVAP
ncbi:MAG: DUF72 domain-containing protein, partial [Clostridia bacterium]|nr:DUF72 domain-containing protein [Clostridia bacterium]